MICYTPAQEIYEAQGVYVTPDSPALPRKWSDGADHVLHKLWETGKL